MTTNLELSPQERVILSVILHEEIGRQERALERCLREPYNTAVKDRERELKLLEAVQKRLAR